MRINGLVLQHFLPTVPSNEIIDKELISNYFEQIKQKYNMLSTSDVRDYSKDLFEKLFK